MKTQTILPILLSLGTALVSSQAIADGLTYDPYENYYHDYYGIDFSSTAISNPETKEKVSSNDPNADYYSTYNSMNIKDKASSNSKPVKHEVVAPASDQDMADPLNYFNW